MRLDALEQLGRTEQWESKASLGHSKGHKCGKGAEGRDKASVGVRGSGEEGSLALSSAVSEHLSPPRTIRIPELLEEPLQFQFLVLCPQDNPGPLPVQAGVSAGGGFGQTGFLTSTPSRARTLPLEVLDTVGQAHPHQMVGDLLACSSFQIRKDGFHHILACEGEAAGQYEGV